MSKAIASYWNCTIDALTTIIFVFLKISGFYQKGVVVISDSLVNLFVKFVG
jgi:hypothetical protein